jgi:hypothetical protein
MDRPFRVVTHRSWMAKHFASYGAVQDFRFDIWGYDRDRKYNRTYDRAPLQASPFVQRK